MRKNWDRRIRHNVNVDQSIAGIPPTSFYENQSNDELLELTVSDYLSSSGFLETLVFRRPQRDGLPIPWFTFSALEFFESLDLSGKTVVEIGSGFSTLYWARKGLRGISFEADAEWTSIVLSALDHDANGVVIDVVSLHEVSTTSLDFQSDDIWEDVGETARDLAMTDVEVEQRPFGPVLAALLARTLPSADLVVIDGVLRNMCMSLAAELCAPTCLVVVDNAERPEYKDGARQLLRSGWSPTPFTGLGPLNPYQWTTTIWRRV